MWLWRPLRWDFPRGQQSSLGSSVCCQASAHGKGRSCFLRTMYLCLPAEQSALLFVLTHPSPAFIVTSIHLNLYHYGIPYASIQLPLRLHSHLCDVLPYRPFTPRWLVVATDMLVWPPCHHVCYLPGVLHRRYNHYRVLGGCGCNAQADPCHASYSTPLVDSICSNSVLLGKFSFRLNLAYLES